MPESATHAIFLSYAHEDTDAARRIADALRSHGLEVWFDQNELRGGDTWDAKIRRQIKECALFVPLISANTQVRKEGYFRLEWKLAAERTHLMAEGVPFLTPVVADSTTESGALVPGEFLRVQWTRLPGALVTPQFIEQIKRLLGGSNAPMPSQVAPGSSPASRHGAGGTPALPQAPQRVGRRVPAAAWSAAIAALVVALIAGALFWRRPTETNAGAGTRPPTTENSALTSPATPTSAPPKISAKSIAVLPLANMSEDKDTGFFADGVHEDLLTNLALVSELKVVSRTTAMQYRGTMKSMKQIGEELGVAYILEGSVRRSGNKVRVTAQLINARTDEHVWAKSYDRDLTDIFTIQASLSQEIASALQAAITPQAQKFIERRPTENPLAYDDYLKGRDIRNRAPTGSQAALDDAEKLFQSAVTLDPKFAAAWGELATVHALKVFWDRDASEARKAMGDAAIARAASLAPEAPDVIRAVGTYAYYAYRDYPRATAAYEKILTLQPNDPTAYASLGLILRRQGRWTDALANLQRAVDLDPANISNNRNLRSTLVNGHRWAEVATVQRRLVALLPGQLREEIALADGELTATGSFKAIDELVARLTPAQRETALVIHNLKYWAWSRGDFAEFKRLDQLQPSYAEEEAPLFTAAIAGMTYLAYGEGDTARARVATAFPATQELLRKEPSNLRARMMLGSMEIVRGRPVEGVRLIREVSELVPISRDAIDGPNCLYWLIEAYALTGDKERALTELAKFLRLPSTFSPHRVRTDPILKTLHGDPRFEALLNDPQNNAPLF